MQKLTERLSACDEMIDRQGRIRGPWGPVMSAVREIGPEELERTADMDRHPRAADPALAVDHLVTGG